MINSQYEKTFTASSLTNTFDLGERVVLFGFTDTGTTVSLQGSYDNENWENLTSLTAAANTAQSIQSIHQWIKVTGLAGTTVKLIACDPRSISSLGIF